MCLGCASLAFLAIFLINSNKTSSTAVFGMSFVPLLHSCLVIFRVPTWFTHFYSNSATKFVYPLCLTILLRSQMQAELGWFGHDSCTWLHDSLLYSWSGWWLFRLELDFLTQDKHQFISWSWELGRNQLLYFIYGLIEQFNWWVMSLDVELVCNVCAMQNTPDEIHPKML